MEVRSGKKKLLWPGQNQQNQQRQQYLDDVFDERLVGADLGALQPADVFADPGDEGELGPLAHGVSRGESDETEQTSVI